MNQIFLYGTSLNNVFVDDVKDFIFINSAIKVGSAAVHDFNQWFTETHTYTAGFLQHEIQIFGFLQCFDLFVGFAGSCSNATTTQPYYYLCFTHIF